MIGCWVEFGPGAVLPHSNGVIPGSLGGFHHQVGIFQDLLFGELPELFLDEIGGYTQTQNQDRNRHRIEYQYAS